MPKEIQSFDSSRSGRFLHPILQEKGHSVHWLNRMSREYKLIESLMRIRYGHRINNTRSPYKAAFPLLFVLIAFANTIMAEEWNPNTDSHRKGGSYTITGGKTYTIPSKCNLTSNLTLTATGSGTVTIKRGNYTDNLIVTNKYTLKITGTSTCKVVVDGASKNSAVSISLFSSSSGHQFSYVTFQNHYRTVETGHTGSVFYVNGDNTTFNNCTFDNNISGRGGAVFIGRGTTFNNSTFTNNRALHGGAIYVGKSDEGYTGKLTLNSCTFTGNYISTTSGNGGAIYIENNGSSEVEIKGTTTISGNTAKSGGGGIYMNHPLTVSGKLIVTGNTS